MSTIGCSSRFAAFIDAALVEVRASGGDGLADQLAAHIRDGRVRNGLHPG